jgi:hypothetical protein
MRNRYVLETSHERVMEQLNVCSCATSVVDTRNSPISTDFCLDQFPYKVCSVRKDSPDTVLPPPPPHFYVTFFTFLALEIKKCTNYFIYLIASALGPGRPPRLPDLITTLFERSQFITVK